MNTGLLVLCKKINKNILWDLSEYQTELKEQVREIFWSDFFSPFKPSLYPGTEHLGIFVCCQNLLR
jgi:hypothetical protein